MSLWCLFFQRIQYAREISDVFTKEDGTYVQRPPGPKKPRAIIEREKKLQAQLQQFQQMMMQHMQQQGAGGGLTPSPLLSQPLQAASAIAAQVQQVMQQPSLLAAFPNAAQFRPGQLQHQIPQHRPPLGQHAMAANPYRHPMSSQQNNSFPNVANASDHLGANVALHMGAGIAGASAAGATMMQGHPPPIISGHQPFMGSRGPGSGMMMSRGPPSAGGLQDMKAVPPPAYMSKDAVVAAAAAAAAAAVGAGKYNVVLIR